MYTKLLTGKIEVFDLNSCFTMRKLVTMCRLIALGLCTAGGSKHYIGFEALHGEVSIYIWLAVAPRVNLLDR